MDPNVKKIVNNGTLIRRLAPMIDSPEARELASVASLYSDLLNAFNIRPSFDGFDGCEEAQLLVKWIATHDKGDANLMKRWSSTILFAIADLVAGKLPTG